MLVVCFEFLVLAGSAQAILTGVPTFVTPPNSQLGPITNNTLVITPFANGFSVSGQIDVTVPSTTTGITGLLLGYEVDYPIDPLYPFNPSLFTTTVIDGFSTPPAGTVGNTQGFVHSGIVTLPSTYLVASISSINLSLVAGVDSPPWFPPIGANSATFPFTGASGMVLRQRFEIDGDYQSGPGGIWTIDLPVFTFIIPEPSSGALMITAGLTLTAFRRRRRAEN